MYSCEECSKAKAYYYGLFGELKVIAPMKYKHLCKKCYDKEILIYYSQKID